jgi:hypothetical protein
MRQGQQNRRGRGRNNNNNNNNRKNQNPLTRSFESAGPDIKIRGTPSHIAEKYITLARDALSSGDPVLAENYLQHAEHYNRIILTFREQQVSQGGGDFHPGATRTHSLNPQDGSDGDEFAEEEGEEFNVQGQPQAAGLQADGGQPLRQGEHQHQPRHEHGQQRHNNFQRNDRGDRRDNRFDRERGGERNFRDDRGGGFGEGDGQRHSDGNRQGDGNQQGFRRRDRFQGDRPQPSQGYDQGHQGQGRHANGNGAPRPNGGERRPPQDRSFGGGNSGMQPTASPPAAADDGESLDQPAFLRRPVRRPRREDTDAPAAMTAPTPEPATDDQD